MAHFDEKDLIKLMNLSRIECSQEEKEKFYTSLSRVVDYIETLSEVNTDGITPCNHILETVSNVTREDTIGDLLSREVFLANAPSHVGGMVKVPPIIKLTPS